MIKFFLLVLIMDLDTSMRHTLIEVPACPSQEAIAEDFNKQQKAGEILSWSGMCFPLEFGINVPKDKIEEPVKEIEA